MIIGRIGALWLIFLLSFSVSITFSQETQVKVSSEGDSILIKPIPLAEVSNNTESTLAQIKEIGNSLQPSKDFLEFDSTYNEFQKTVIKNIERLEKREDYYSLMTIENEIRDLTNLKERISNFKETVNDRVSLLQEDLFIVEVMDANWKATRSELRNEDVPAEVQNSISDLIRRIANLRNQVVENQNQELSKQSKITELVVSLDETLSNLENRRSELQSNYFLQDSPPIWKSGDSTTAIYNVKQQLSMNLKETRHSLQSFYDNYKQRVFLQILLFLALWVGLYFLSRIARKMENQDVELGGVNVLSYYGLSALILALFSSIWIYTVMPKLLENLLRFTFIIISLFLLPRLIDKKLNKILILLLMLFLVNQLQTLFFGKVLFTRIVIFVEIILSGYLLYLLTDKKGLVSKDLKKYKWGFILKIIPVFYIFLALSLAGNFFGFVSLSELLNNTVVMGLINLNIVLLAIAVLNRVMRIILRTPFMQGSNLVKNHTDTLDRRLFQIIQILGVLIWLRSILSLLGLRSLLSDWLNEFLEQTYQVGTSTIVIKGIFIFILVILITIIFYRFVKVLLKEEIYPRVTLPRGVPGAISMITGYLIAGFGFFLALGSLTDLKNFGLLAGALGVGIGFGLQGIVANFIAGLVLAFERPIQVGDEIQMAENMGIVTNIGVRSTTIRTYDGSEVIVPNSDLITKDVVNWTLSDRRKRRDIYINAAYGTDPEKVLDLIRKVSSEHPNVQKIPAPWALFEGFGDSALIFRVRIWTTMDTGMTTKSEVTVAIYDALRKAGIEIPFPQRDLHIKSIEKEAPVNISKASPTKKQQNKRIGKSEADDEPSEDLNK